MSRIRLLLLHPPGTEKRRYQLDGSCSQPQKGPFRWHAMDFVAMSTCYQFHATVTIADQSLKKPGQLPDPADFSLIIGLAGAYGWSDQKIFWNKIIANTNARVFLAGDICRHEPDFVFENLLGLSGIIPEVFDPPSIEALLDPEASNRLWLPAHNHIAPGRVARGFSWGVQPYHLWNRGSYRLPFGTANPFASVITQIGCPYVCDYCVVSSQQSSTRNVAEIADELKLLSGTHRVKHIYIRDATLNSSSAHLKQILPVFKNAGLPWNAFARIDGLQPWLQQFAESGCKILQLGIDTESNQVLQNHKKNIRESDLAGVIRTAQRYGIETVGHFVAGLETDKHLGNLVKYARRLGLNWMTISPLMVRPGTSMWDPSCLENLASLEPPRALKIRIAAEHLKFYARSSTFVPLVKSYLGVSASTIVANCHSSVLK